MLTVAAAWRATAHVLGAWIVGACGIKVSQERGHVRHRYLPRITVDGLNVPDLSNAPSLGSRWDPVKTAGQGWKLVRAVGIPVVSSPRLGSPMADGAQSCMRQADRAWHGSGTWPR